MPFRPLRAILKNIRASARDLSVMTATLASLVAAGCGGGASLPAVVPISIDAQPAAQVVVDGQSATFSVSASSASPLVYRWRQDGREIPGATAATYETASASVAGSGSRFSVVISNGTTSIASNQASLTVLAGASVPAVPATLVSATATDPSIDAAFGVHVAFFNASMSQKGKLFVFLAGTGSRPIKYQTILAAAAANGYHAVGLAYSNVDTVQSLCGASTAPDCHAAVREETFGGSDASSLVNVDRSNALVHRLVALLRYLDGQRPDEKWGQYIGADGLLAWSRIRFSGHSQGGGLAAYVGTRERVDRVCSISSPADYDNLRNRPASWVTTGGATAAERYFGFAHRRDNVVPWGNVTEIWAALGMNRLGRVANVDQESAPFSGNQMLGSNLDASDAGVAYHNMTVVDDVTPMRNDGQPVYLQAWQAACFR